MHKASLAASQGRLHLDVHADLSLLVRAALIHCSLISALLNAVASDIAEALFFFLSENSFLTLNEGDSESNSAEGNGDSPGASTAKQLTRI